MRRRIEILVIESETFYGYKWKYGTGVRIPGTESKAFRVVALVEGPEEQTWVHVRRKTRALAFAATKELLGISTERWAKVLERYKARQRRVKEQVERSRRAKMRSILRRARRRK